MSSGFDVEPSTGQCGYDGRHEKLAKIVIARWVRENGWTCPGIGVPAHESHDLVADHLVPVSAGGENVIENYRCVCRGCNSRRLHPRPKLCPDGHTCSQHEPTGSAFCCGRPRA